MGDNGRERVKEGEGEENGDKGNAKSRAGARSGLAKKRA